MFMQNYSDWDRFEAAERGESVPAVPALDDQQVFAEDMKVARLSDELGFDSLFTVEHHFTPYTMVPNPLQILTYLAGVTENVDLGTMVVVLPWHNPVRLAEEIGMLTTLLGDRKLILGVGRGIGRREYNGLQVDMTQTREMFAESMEIIRRAFTQPTFSFEGKHNVIPETSIRPRPASADFLEDVHMAWGSPQSLPIAAQMGLKPFVIPQRPLPEYVPELEQYDALRAEAGFAPVRPKIVVWVHCSESSAAGAAESEKYFEEYGDSAVRHYELKGSHFHALPGYEHYAQTSDLLKENDVNFGKAFMSEHVFGTPEECVAKITRINDLLGPSEFVCVFKFGSMTGEDAERSLRLFAREALPEVKKLPIRVPAAV
jgi:alkanesulfonate monooxygenase SsuD/methylene tetrahydromethanopterin reductase-like flavin-dependent oxidoreductase (luciferase family)